MITAKHRFLALLLILCCLFLSSCKTDMTGLSGLQDLGSERNDEALAETVFEYNCVILPEAASDTLVSRARALADALAERTGLPTSLYFENEEFLVHVRTRLILLGNLDHARSQAHLHELRRDDYLCRLDEGHLILGGKSDAATIAAIDRFTEALLPYVDEEILINSDQQFLVRATYAVTEAILNGYSLQDYRIVYPKNAENGEKGIAYRLREVLADRCGFYPDVVPDHHVTEPTRVIAIGTCFGESIPLEAQIVGTESGIFLFGSSEYTLASAAQHLCDVLLPAHASGTVSLTIDEPIVIPNASPALSAFVGLIQGRENDYTLLEIAELSTALRTSCAPIAPMGTVNSNTLFYLQSNLSDYTCLAISAKDERILPLFYREDALTLLEQATSDHSMRLRFQLKESGICFTLLHGIARTKEDQAHLLAAASQVSTQNEPTLLFFSTPSTLALEEAVSSFRGPFTISKETSCVQMLVLLPSELASTEILADEENSLYTFQFTHPFLKP